jgi:glyoxylase-like metal-dependent hydrolase (beta-lactamase superfamily II)
MEKPYQVMDNVHILPAFFPIPGMGFLPVNAFVIMGKEPVLIDTGMGIDREEFMKALESIVDPKDLKWIWLTHDDADHSGNLRMVLEAAPNARFVANALAVLRSSTVWPVPMDRAYWLNPGEKITAGEHELMAVRPPIFDNPTTIAIYDRKLDALFSADFFGAIIPSPEKNADDLTETDLSQGMIVWATADSPWVHMADAVKFGKALGNIRQIAPRKIFSAHLPPAQGKTEGFLKVLEKLPDAAPFVTPDQKALEQILAQMKNKG